MSNIDKQAVQAIADLKSGHTLGHADVEIIQQMALEAVTLLDELEAKETGNERMARELLNRNGEIEGLRQRIAELEVREINLPPYSFFDFKQGSTFKSGAYCHIDSVNKELSKHGIKMIAAAGKGEAS